MADRLVRAPIPLSPLVDSRGQVSNPAWLAWFRQLQQEINDVLPLSAGGTNASLTAAAGAVIYSTASALALSAAGTSGQVLRSAGTGAPTWSTATYPATAGTAAHALLSDGTNFATAAIVNALAAGSGIGVSATTGTVTVTNVGVTAVTGTADQVIASAGTGAVVLSLPQSIATTSTPTFSDTTLAHTSSGAETTPLVLGNLVTATSTAVSAEWRAHATTSTAKIRNTRVGSSDYQTEFFNFDTLGLTSYLSFRAGVVTMPLYGAGFARFSSAGALSSQAASAAYTPTNVTTDRAYDANATSTDELADVLGTLVADLQAAGILG